MFAKPVNIHRLVRTAAAVVGASMLVSVGGTASLVRPGAGAAVATRAGAIADELPPPFSFAQKTAAIYRRMIEMTNAEAPRLNMIPESIYRKLEAIVADVRAKGREG